MRILRKNGRFGFRISPNTRLHGNPSSTILKVLGPKAKATYQRNLKNEVTWLNPYKHSAKNLNRKLALVTLVNDADRDLSSSIPHSLFVKSSGSRTPLRVQLMSRSKARKLNQFNRENAIDLIWVQGGAL